jgi:hypothetical protein
MRSELYRAARHVSRLNYHEQTKAIWSEYPDMLTSQQLLRKLTDEADVLNMAVFNTTASEWKEANPDLKGNIRDNATEVQLIVLAFLELTNAAMLRDEIDVDQRMERLNDYAIKLARVLKTVFESMER